MWSFVETVKANLDEAAGFTATPPLRRTEAVTAGDETAPMTASTVGPTTSDKKREGDAAQHTNEIHGAQSSAPLSEQDHLHRGEEEGRHVDNSTDSFSSPLVAADVSATNTIPPSMFPHTDIVAATRVETVAADAIPLPLPPVPHRVASAPPPVTSAAVSRTEEQLIREGMLLSEQVHAEREKVKHLLLERRTLQEQSEAIATSMQELNQRARNQEESRRAAVAAQTASQERVSILELQVARLASESMSTTHAIQRATEDADTVKLEARMALDRAGLAMEEQRAEYHQAMLSKDAEVESLRAQLRKTAVDSETRIALLERELSDAHTRAHAAERRGIELCTSASDVSQEMQLHVVALEHRLAAAAQSRTEAVEALEAQRAENANLKRTLAARDAGPSERVRELTAQVLSLQTVAADLRRDLEKERRERGRAVERVGELSREVERLHAQQVQDQVARRMAVPPQPSHSLDEGRDADVPSDVAPGGRRASGAASSRSDHDRSLEKDGSGGVRSALNASAKGDLERREVAMLRSRLEEVQATLDRLSRQHDALLQMYGQLVTETQAAPAAAPPAAIIQAAGKIL